MNQDTKPAPFNLGDHVRYVGAQRRALPAGYGNVTEPRLYQLIRQREPIADRTFEIEFLDAGVATYAFTFG